MCADLDAARARARADEFGIARIATPVEVLEDETVEIVVNLTPPTSHAAVSLAILRGRKHVYSEKPLATTLAEGAALLDEADGRGLRVGCAPDTFLSAPIQLARQAVEDGRIGRPVAAFAAFAARSVEAWHPNPAFFFAPGAGPVLDMGPVLPDRARHAARPGRLGQRPGRHARARADVAPRRPRRGLDADARERHGRVRLGRAGDGPVLVRRSPHAAAADRGLRDRRLAPAAGSQSLRRRRRARRRRRTMGADRRRPGGDRSVAAMASSTSRWRCATAARTARRAPSRCTCST